MDLTEYKCTSRRVFDGTILHVDLDTVTLPNGATATREVVRHPGGVTILPLHDDGTVTLVRQYRYPYATVMCELPAGKLDVGEDPLVAAQRELAEETGLVAETYTYLGGILPSVGFCDEVLHLYLAQNLTQGDCHPDEDEFLTIERQPFHQLVEQVMDNTLQDGKTVAALLKTKVLLGL